MEETEGSYKKYRQLSFDHQRWQQKKKRPFEGIRHWANRSTFLSKRCGDDENQKLQWHQRHRDHQIGFRCADYFGRFEARKRREDHRDPKRRSHVVHRIRMRWKVLKPIRSSSLRPNRTGALSNGKRCLTRKSLISQQACIKLIISIGIYESDASYIKLCSIVIYNQY